MINPEKAYIFKYGAKDDDLTPAEQVVYENCITPHRQSISPLDDFRDIYPELEIQADKKNIERIKREHSEKTKRAEILEAVLAQQIEQSDWFGENCRVYPTTEYDDLVNHTDLVVQLEKANGQVISIGLDVTTATDEDKLREKVSWTTREIERGQLSEIKYSQAEEGESLKHEKLQLASRVIIGTDAEGVTALSEMMHDVIKREPGSKARLGQYYLQIEILEEISKQLNFYINYAVKKGFLEDHPNIAKRHEALLVIDKILQNKKRSIPVRSEARSNKIYKFIEGLAA
jgi:hypothetical protein